MKILYAAAECAPFIKSGGLGDVAQSLPKAFASLGHETAVVLPLYKSVRSKFADTLTYVTNFFVPLSWRQVYCGVFTCELSGVRCWFIDNEYYFDRDNIYGDFDDCERFAFFSKAALEMLPHIGFYPDVINSNDWQCALISVFFRAFYSHLDGYGSIKQVFTIHNIEYQGKASFDFLREVLGMDEYFMRFLSFGGCINLMHAAILLSDRVTTVSRTYAEEITDAYYGRGLDGVLRENRHKLSGIVNGIDTGLFDPWRDTDIYVNYGMGKPADKWKNKAKLQEETGLDVNAEAPVIGMVTRLAEHKGLDLVLRVVHEILARGVQLVLLGTGDAKYEDFFRQLSWKYPQRVSSNIFFDNTLARRIYAGADLFLMPSMSEPCGLSQMIAMRYGCIPVVRETGGLKDTVFPINPQSPTAGGFTFKSYNAHDMLDAVNRALDFYYVDKTNLKKLIRENMKCDFGWDASAREYISLYESI